MAHTRTRTRARRLKAHLDKRILASGEEPLAVRWEAHLIHSVRVALEEMEWSGVEVERSPSAEQCNVHASMQVSYTWLQSEVKLTWRQLRASTIKIRGSERESGQHVLRELTLYVKMQPFLLVSHSYDEHETIDLVNRGVSELTEGNSLRVNTSTNSTKFDALMENDKIQESTSLRSTRIKSNKCIF